MAEEAVSGNRSVPAWRTKKGGFVNWGESGGYRETVRAWLRTMSDDELAGRLAWAPDDIAHANEVEDEAIVARLVCAEAARRLSGGVL